jgi:hypothetical protein
MPRISESRPSIQDPERAEQGFRLPAATASGTGVPPPSGPHRRLVASVSLRIRRLRARDGLNRGGPETIGALLLPKVTADGGLRCGRPGGALLLELTPIESEAMVEASPEHRPQTPGLDVPVPSASQPPPNLPKMNPLSP